jgi:imidazolonepropionase-like amidohydrolase
MGFKKGKSLIMRDAVDAGMIIGPRILSCGEAISMTGGHGWELNLEADGPDEVRRAVRQQLKAGADFIKLFASGGYIDRTKDQPWSMQYNEDELRAGFLEAKKAGKKTTVHCHPPVAIQASIRAGVDCIEHGALIDRESAELMAREGVYLVPTVGEGWMMAYRGLEMGRPAWQVEMAREHLLESRTMELAIEAGIKMAVGTDVISSMMVDMKLMVEGGLSPMEVVVAATRNGAEVCDILDETGTLEKGKSADLIVIDGNPLVDIEALERVVQVVVRGKTYDTAELASATGVHPL